MNRDNVRRYIETEHRCEVFNLAVSKIVSGEAVQSWKVDGHANRNGMRGIVGGMVNERNFSGIKVWWADSPDNPFLGL